MKDSRGIGLSALLPRAIVFKSSSKTKDKEKFTRNMVIDIEYIMNMCEHKETKSKIEKLLEDARNCRVSASRYISNIEVEIKNAILSLSECVELNNYVFADNEIEKIKRLIIKREELCKE